jgi:hypothetical protein
MTAIANNNIQIRMGQRDHNWTLLRLRWQLPRLGTLEQLERRQGTHSILHGLQVDCLDILSVSRLHVWQHVR